MALGRAVLILIGISLIGSGYVVGFEGVGDPEVEYRVDGPQGPGYYEVETTYPGPGIAMILGGLGLSARGVRGGGGETEEDEQPDTKAEAAQGDDETVSERIECPNCGERLLPSAEFCTDCGEEVKV